MWKKVGGPSGPDTWLSSELGLAGLLDSGDSEEQELLLAVLVAGEGSGDPQGEAPTTRGGGRLGVARGETWDWATPKNRDWAPESFSPL